jgi:hypothetical protein
VVVVVVVVAQQTEATKVQVGRVVVQAVLALAQTLLHLEHRILVVVAVVVVTLRSVLLLAVGVGQELSSSSILIHSL